ncbi:MAG: transposase, partial [Candidatus Cloacimonetes bacterium]|nr:transposase [Candidatus Cloacimonadota bacterium]
KDILKRLRLSYINTIPEAQRTIRSGIEATIRQFKCKTKAGKTKLRGLYRHKLWFTLLALAINIKRIFNYTTGLFPKRRIRRASFSAGFFDVINELFDLFEALTCAARQNSTHYLTLSRTL